MLAWRPLSRSSGDCSPFPRATETTSVEHQARHAHRGLGGAGPLAARAPAPQPPPLTWLVPAFSARLPSSGGSRFSRSAFRAPSEPARRFRGRVLGPKAKPALPAARAGGAHGGVSFGGRGGRWCARSGAQRRACGRREWPGPAQVSSSEGAHVPPPSWLGLGRQRGGRRRTANTKQTAGEGPRSDGKAEL